MIMYLGIRGEKMELLEMLENIEIAYHDLVIKYYYASKIDKDKRKELYYQCEEEFKALSKKLSEVESLEKELGHSLEKFSKATKIYSDLQDKMKEYKIIGVNFPENKIYFLMDFVPMYVEFGDYKKIWWLKEDKSE